MKTQLRNGKTGRIFYLLKGSGKFQRGGVILRLKLRISRILLGRHFETSNLRKKKKKTNNM